MQTFNSKNAGSRTLGVTGYTVNDGNNGGNYAVATETALGTIAQAVLTLAATADTKTYDATTASAGTVNVTGLAGADTVTGAEQTFDTKNAGSRTLTVTGYTVNDGNSGGNYTISTQTAAGTINQAALTASLTGTVAKTYDGTTAATLASGNYSLTGVMGSDGVTLNNPASGAYADRNAGSGKNVSVAGLTISGGDAANYTVNPTVSGNIGTINQAALTLAATTENKTYDGTAASSGTVNVTGLIGADTVTDRAQTFDSKNAGARTLGVSAYTINDGNNGGNYAVTTQIAAGAIGQAALTLTAGADSKTYDGTTDSTGAFSIAGLVGSDTVTGQSQTFDSKNAGSRTLSVTGYTINDGNNGGNYAVTSQTAAGAISQAALTLAATSANKSYDGTTASSGTVNVTGLKGADTVTGQSQVYDTKDAGSRTLSVAGYTINDGNSGGNYALTTQTAAGAINQAVLTLSLDGSTVTKVYDGTTAATLNSGNYTLTGVAPGETVTVNRPATGTYSDKNAGTGKTVTVTGLELSGPGTSNYTIGASASGNVGVIQPAALTLAATADSKSYDGTIASPGTVNVAGLIGSDTVTGRAQSYDSKNAGSRTLGVSAYTINDGNSGGNYTVATHTAVGSISQAALTLAATSSNKTYDGNTESSGAVNITGLQGSDTVTGQTQRYDSRNAGGRTLSVTGYTVNDGNNGGNYTVSTQTANGTINQAALTAALTGTVSKVYDGTTAATLTAGNYTIPDVVAGDAVTINTHASANYADRNAGTGKTVTVNGLSLSGSDAGNYTLNSSASGNIGAISQAALTLTASPASKTYDGTAASSGTVAVSGLIGSDTVAGQTQSFDSKNAGNRTLGVTGYTVNDGNNGGNYSVTTQSAAGTINRAALTLAATGENKTYDGTTGSTGIVSVGGLVGSDTIAGQTQSFDSRNAGSRTLNVTGYTINDGNNGGNYTVTTQTAAGTISQAALRLAATPATKAYDGTTASNVPVTVTGLAGADSVTGQVQTYDSKNAGNRTLAVSGYQINDGNNGANYTVTTQTAAGAIDQAVLTINFGGTTISKVYDGTTTVTLNPDNYNLMGVVPGEAVTVNRPATGNYSDKNAGTGKTITLTGLELSGAGSSNYTISATASGNAGVIQPAALTMTASADNKTYDGTTASSGPVSVSGLIGTDTVSDPRQAFDSRNAGSRALGVSGYTINDGNNGGNYTVTTQSAAGSIARAALTLAATGANKTYDGTTASSAPATVTGLMSTDTIAGLTQTYDSRNAGDRTLTLSGHTINDGNGGNNYLVTTQSATGAITPAALTALLTGTTSKVYDGTTAATLTPGNYSLPGVVGGDAVTVNQPATGNYSDKNAGAGKTVTAGGLVLSGAGAGNYTLNPVASGTIGSITPAALTMTANSDIKTYDGTNASAGTVTVSGLIASDTISDPKQTFDSKNAGARTIDVTGYTINDGNNGGNYTVSTRKADGGIRPAEITLTPTGGNKPYDGTTNSNAPIIADGLKGSDSLTGNSNYGGKGVGTYPISISGQTIDDGNGGKNYIVTTQTATGTITQAPLAALLTGTISKVYDGTTAAVLAPGNYTLPGVVGGETVTINTPAAGVYDNRNAGNGKAVTVTGMTLGGPDAGNYTISSTATGTTGTIIPAPLAMVASAGNKTYDGTAVSSGPVSVNGLVGGDTTAAVTQSYDSKNVGSRTIGVSGYTINDGNSGGNYTVTTQSSTGTISAANLTVAANPVNKTYDGTTDSVASLNITGLVGSDTVTDQRQRYESKNVGTWTLRVGGFTVNDGNNGANYNTTTQSAMGAISPATLTAALTGSIAKIYDGTTAALLTPGNYNLLGVFGSDEVGINTPASANYANKNVGMGKTVTVSGMTLSGAGAGNYLLNPTATGTIGTITPAALSLTASGGAKTYDGTVNSAGPVSVSGLVGSDTIAGQTQSYDSRNAGARTIAVTGYTINDGYGGGNYTVTTQSAPGTITPAPLIAALTGTTSKAYDGTTAATLTPGNYFLTGVVGGDAISLNTPASGMYTDKNPGTGKTVLAAGLAISGEAASNYTVNSTAAGDIGTIVGGAAAPNTVAQICPTGISILPVFNTVDRTAPGGTCWIPMPAIKGELTATPTTSPSVPYPANQKVSSHILFVDRK